MSDSLHRVVLPADGQRSFEELREEYREANRQRIRRALRPHDVVRYRKDGSIAGRVTTGLMIDIPAGQDHRTIRDWQRDGGVVPDFTNEFLIPEGPGLDRELRDLARDAAALSLHEGVRYPNDNPEGDNHHADELSTAEDEHGSGTTT